MVVDLGDRCAELMFTGSLLLTPSRTEAKNVDAKRYLGRSRAFLYRDSRLFVFQNKTPRGTHGDSGKRTSSLALLGMEPIGA